MAHMYLELPFSADTLVAVVDEALWLSNRTGALFASIDLASSAERARFADPGPPLDRLVLRFGPVAVVERKEYSLTKTTAYDLSKNGERLWSAERREMGNLGLVGATVRGPVLAFADELGESWTAEELSPTTGKVLRTVTLRPNPVPDGVLVVGDRIYLSNLEKLVAVDLAEGKELWLVPSEVASGARFFHVGDQLFVARNVDETTGPSVSIDRVDPDRGKLRQVARIEGTMTGVLSGESLALIAADGSVHAFVEGVDPVPFTADLLACRIDGELALIGQNACLNVLRASNAAIEGARVPLPGAPRSFLVHAGMLFTVAEHLLSIDLRALTFGPSFPASDLELFPLDAKAGAAPSGDEDQVTVLISLPGTLLADHPKYGRLRIERKAGDPAVAKGDTIVLDRVAEELPGIWKVKAWRLPGGERARSAGAPLLLTKDGVPPRHEAVAELAPSADRESLAVVFEGLGLDVPELLDRIFGLYDEDSIARGWIDRFVFIPTPPDAEALPFLRIGDTGNGDEVGLYIAPERVRRGEPLPVVEWLHEEDTLSWAAPSIDAYVTRALAKGEASLEPARAGLADRLDIGQRAASAESSAPPRWWRAAARAFPKRAG